MRPTSSIPILDDLEKLSETGEVQAAAQAMFLNHADALRTPAVHLVYTVPVRLVFSGAAPELGKHYDGEPQVLPMVKLRERATGEPLLKGHQALRTVLERRLDVAEVFGDDTRLIDRLVASSGGYIRDLLRLVQYSLQIATQHDAKLPVREEHVANAIAKLRRSYVKAYSTAYQPLMKHIEEHRPEVVPEELSAHLADVLAGHMVMVYGNDVDWYDIHPLLHDLVRT